MASGGTFFAPLLVPLPPELAGFGLGKPSAGSGALLFVREVGRFLLRAVSGVIAHGSGFPAALAVLAIAHLLVVVFGSGLRIR
jgi:hypothetical protein